MVTSSPIVVGCVPFITCTIVPSWIFVRFPTRIRCTSPRRTAHIQTLLSSPTSTSPMTCADSSMKAEGWTRGTVPRYGRSTVRIIRAGWAPGLDGQEGREGLEGRKGQVGVELLEAGPRWRADVGRRLGGRCELRVFAAGIGAAAGAVERVGKVEADVIGVGSRRERALELRQCGGGI